MHDVMAGYVKEQEEYDKLHSKNLTGNYDFSGGDEDYTKQFEGSEDF